MGPGQADSADSHVAAIPVDSPHGLVCTVDRRATEAGAAALRRGGSAADAAISANAVLAVTSPHLCGMGGDLWALVHRSGAPPEALNASGRAGRGVDAARVRATGGDAMPFRADPVSVPVPGCVDGWLALHARHGRLPLTEVLAPAIHHATEGFTAAPLLAAAAVLVDHLGVDGIDAALRPGATLRRPGVAGALRAIADAGRDGFYGGTFGRGLVELGGGVFTREDLRESQADWVEPVGAPLLGSVVWTVPPNSQGYLVLAILTVATRLGLPADDTDPAWLRSLVAASVVTGADRPGLLHEHADPAALLAGGQVDRWVDAARRWAPHAGAPPLADGDTTYVCTRDGDGLAVSLIQSNAADFGAHLVEPRTGIFLHNRGVGFNLVPGHPAELAPRRRPPSTLSPVLITDRQDELVAVAGTMGGDSQPHLVAQHLARLLAGGRAPAAVLAAPRWVLQRTGDRGFALWLADGGAADPGYGLCTDRHGRDRWAEGVDATGLGVEVTHRRSPSFGHAHLIARGGDSWVAAAEPRVDEAAAASSAPEGSAPG